MTHTLNRRGLSEKRAGEEIVVLCMVHQPQKEEKREEMRQMARLILEHGPDNIIGAPLGLDEDQIVEFCSQAGIVTAVFSDKEKARKLVGEIKARNLGISVVLSALFSDVREICRCWGLTEHTYNISLGIFGRTQMLPPERTLEITTQCGHSLISPLLVKHVVSQIKKGRMSLEEATKLLVKPCVCGIVNPKRTKRILQEMVTQSPPTPQKPSWT
jgi:hypothetical protein